MKYMIFMLIIAVFVCLPNLAFANCSMQTIMIDGRMVVCTVCYDMQGKPIMTTCN
jgi:hypothetical protein